MLEIIEGVFYDPAKQWYEQDPQLINLAEEVMSNSLPIDSETETSGSNSRLKWGIWEHTTDMGTFRMRVDMSYMFPIENPAFQRKIAQDSVTVTKL